MAAQAVTRSLRRLDTPMAALLAEYINEERTPTTLCPGCGHGIAVGTMLQAVHELGLRREQVAVVNGIGCTGHMGQYLAFDTFRGTHGRVPAQATGLKMVRPELKVLCLMGDGDSVSIGGNHFIHACRRNVDLTAIILNNEIYGMTGGQHSPTTPLGQRTTTAPFGTVEGTFDICRLAIAAGATYVARATTYHPRLLIKLIKNAILHPGFAVVEARTQCPTIRGRLIGMERPIQMLYWFRDHAVPVALADKMPPAQLADKFLIGELHRSYRPELVSECDKVIAHAQAAMRS